MKKPIKGLYAIADTTLSPQLSHFELARTLLGGGCKILQLRYKPDNTSNKSNALKKIHKIANDILSLKKGFDFTFIINDYVGIAADVGADGVHVGSKDMHPEKIKARYGERFLIGRSSHSFEEAVKNAALPVDYVALGAIYPTTAKGPEHPVLGVKILEDVVCAVKKPVVAIGGINRGNVTAVWSTGVSAVAMITGLTKADNIIEETKWFVETLK